jgi:hypothetical protein
MAMSQAVRGSDQWVPTQTPVGGTANTAAAAELAVRAVVAVVGVQAISVAVRRHPWLSLFFATGLGYLFGTGWAAGPARSTKPPPNQSRKQLAAGGR